MKRPVCRGCGKPPKGRLDDASILLKGLCWACLHPSPSKKDIRHEAPKRENRP